MKKNKSGFTLLEVLVTTTIILILTIAGVASYASITKKSRDARRRSDMEQLRQGLEMYRSDNGYYSAANSGSAGSAGNLSGTLVTTYMPVIPTDPTLNATSPYTYQATNSQGSPAHYYGYCLCGVLENGGGTNTCPGYTPTSPYNYCVPNP